MDIVSLFIAVVIPPARLGTYIMRHEEYEETDLSREHEGLTYTVFTAPSLKLEHIDSWDIRLRFLRKPGTRLIRFQLLHWK